MHVNHDVTVNNEQYTNKFSLHFLNVAKSLLIPRGWILHSVYIVPHQHIHFLAEPPNSWRKWIIGQGFPSSAKWYDAKMYGRVIRELQSLKLHGNSATAVVVERFSECTPFCQLVRATWGQNKRTLQTLVVLDLLGTEQWGPFLFNNIGNRSVITWRFRFKLFPGSGWAPDSTIGPHHTVVVSAHAIN